MGLPRVLKDMMIHNDSLGYVGEAESVTPPKLVRKFEEWRGAGMDRPVQLDMGGEALECEFTCGGPMRDVLRQYGMTNIAGAMLRFTGVFENDETGDLDSIRMTMRGRHQEVDFGEWKPGEKAAFKVKSALTYFRLEWNDRVEIEVDVLNMVEIVGGVDLLAARRAALDI